MHVHRLFVIIMGHKLDWAYLDYSRVINQHINPAEVLLNDTYHGVHLVAISDIAWDGQHMPVVLPQIVKSAFQFRPITSANGDFGPLAQHVAREHQA
jgi:hypothetical protein